MFPNGFIQKLMAFGDDGWLSNEIRKNGYEVAFAKNIFCYNLERDYQDWGYTKNEVAEDPRKSGYGPPFKYEPLDWISLLPPENLRMQ
jgi:hypothetical protein